MIRKILAGLFITVMALPIIAQTPDSGVIAITGASITVTEETVTIEGAPSVLPTVYAGEDGIVSTFYGTQDFVNDWAYGIEKIADLNLTEEDFYATVTVEVEVVTTVDGVPTAEVFDQTLVVTAPVLSEEGVLSFTVLEYSDVVGQLDDKSVFEGTGTAFIVNVVFDRAFQDVIFAAAEKRADDGRVTTVTSCNPRSAC